MFLDSTVNKCGRICSYQTRPGHQTGQLMCHFSSTAATIYIQLRTESQISIVPDTTKTIVGNEKPTQSADAAWRTSDS